MTIEEIESRLKSATFTPPIKLSQGVTVNDVDKMIDTHLSICKAAQSAKQSRVVEAYKMRLEALLLHSEKK